LTVWDIPASFYLPIDDVEGVPLIQHLPRWKLARDGAAIGVISLLSPPSQWVSSGCRLPFFGLCTAPEVEGYAATMRCYTFESIDPPHNSQLQRFDPLRAGFVHSLPLSIFDSEIFLRHLRFCDRYLVIAWPYGSHINISLMPTPIDPDKGVPSKTQNLKFKSDPCEDIVIKDFDFCPASGRLVVTTDSGDIRIMDYLSPPMSGSQSVSTPFGIRTISDISSLIAIDDH